MFSLENKVIVVTGGNGLLGGAMLKRLREAGAIGICADISVEINDSLNIRLDITDEQSVRSVTEELITQYGRIDGWVNNAYPRTKDWGLIFEEIPVASWRQNVDMHLNGYFICCQVVLEIMKKQKSGSLINMSSIYGLVGPDFTIYEGTKLTNAAGYAAIKGGLVNLTRYLAAYYGAAQVRVNCVSPGGIFDNQPEVFVENYEHKVPLKKMGTPNDIVGAIHFLLADDSSYITGHNLLVDGGWSAI